MLTLHQSQKLKGNKQKLINRRESNEVEEQMKLYCLIMGGMYCYAVRPMIVGNKCI